jgi:hypothetical protein
MDIHPPLGKTESLKEFFTHILIVTVGILIALSLEGVRESWREHVAVSEARESFREELKLNREQLAKDQQNVRQVDAQLDQIISAMPQLARSPAALEKRVLELQPGFYFFRTTSWESAMSSGALAHMNRKELDGFVDAYLGVKNYQMASQGAFPEWAAVETYFQSHHSYSSAEEAEGEQKLRTLKMGLQVMQHLGEEMSAGIEEAVGKS